VKIKNEIKLPENSKYSIGQFISKQFSNLFSSYAQAFNKQQNRRGNLFISNFKRRKVDSDEYLTRLIKYIHFNPVAHGFVQDISSWKFSSFSTLNSDTECFLAREKVFEWRVEFLKAHERGLENDIAFDVVKSWFFGKLKVKIEDYFFRLALASRISFTSTFSRVIVS
jgi:hypothetical protein